jgi:hypothetical protein
MRSACLSAPVSIPTGASARGGAPQGPTPAFATSTSMWQPCWRSASSNACLTCALCQCSRHAAAPAFSGHAAAVGVLLGTRSRGVALHAGKGHACWKSVTSARQLTSRPWAPGCLLRSAPRSASAAAQSLMSSSETPAAPCCRNWRANSKPMPDPPPVMATCPTLNEQGRTREHMATAGSRPAEDKSEAPLQVQLQVLDCKEQRWLRRTRSFDYVPEKPFSIPWSAPFREAKQAAALCAAAATGARTQSIPGT